MDSYAGLRSVTIRGKAVLINGRSVFQRLVLDQGYYPDGILTAPSDTALVKDIELSMAAGFNGARLHEKALDDVTWGMFLATKAADPSRPVLDTSGYSHRVPETDVWDSHNYEQDPGKFRQAMAGLAQGKPFANVHTVHGRDWPISRPYGGQPYFCSEFGGTRWNPDSRPGDTSWGYGESPKTLDQWYARFEGLCRVLLEDPDLFGYCYTQLTDVFQEQNGIYRFDRSVKFDLARLAAVQRRPAAIESV